MNKLLCLLLFDKKNQKFISVDETRSFFVFFKYFKYLPGEGAYLCGDDPSGGGRSSRS